MPKGQDFYNPYRLIPRQGDGPDRKYHADISTLGGYSGWFECRLITFTALEVKGVSTHDGRPKQFSSPPVVIPGTSLKGMVRAMVEFLAPGCFGVEAPGDRLGASAWSHCVPDSGRGICVTCLMFGALSSRAALRGRVRIDDAVPIANGAHPLPGPFHLYSGPPQLTHQAFYPIGPYQKFYHHQPTLRRKPRTVHPQTKNSFQVHPVAPGSLFGFKAYFEGLDDLQLSLLHYGLALEPGLLHRLGRGKPQGMGSVQVGIVGMEITTGASRYVNQGNPLTELPETALDLRRELESRSGPSMQDFRRMLLWRPEDTREFHYPDHAWFDEEGNSAIPLRSIRELYPEPFAPTEPIPPNAPSRRAVVAPLPPLTETQEIHEDCSLRWKPNSQELEAVAGAKVIGAAIGKSALTLIAQLDQANADKLRKKKALTGVRVVVSVLSNQRTITKLETA